MKPWYVIHCVLYSLNGFIESIEIIEISQYFATIRFSSNLYDFSSEREHMASIDSMDVTIEYDTEKNKISSHFAVASLSRPPSASEKRRKKRSEIQWKARNERSASLDEDEELSIGYPEMTVTNSNVYRVQRHKFIINLDDKDEKSQRHFRPFTVFWICWVSHGVVQLLMLFITALFGECYPSRFVIEIGICQHRNANLWLLLLWSLIILTVLFNLLFIGYIRNLWLLHFHDGATINVHYQLMMGQIEIPRFRCCEWLYFCELQSVFDSHGLLQKHVRDSSLSPQEVKAYTERMKNQLANI